MRVMVVDDMRLLRDSIVKLLRVQGHEVLGEASSGREAIAKADLLHPDVILMDLRMPGISGFEATRTIKSQHPEIRIVMLTASTDEGDLAEAVKSGADGYLLKDITADELCADMEELKRGGTVLSKVLAGKLLEQFKSQSQALAGARQGPSLTVRERQVLEYVAAGLSNRESGDRLFITENTVKYHMKRILEKLQVENRAQAIAWASRHIPMTLPPPPQPLVLSR